MKAFIASTVAIACAFVMWLFILTPANAEVATKTPVTMDHCVYSGGGWLCAGLEPPNHPWPDAERIAGANRYETAVEISQVAFANGSETLYVANGEVSADALAAGMAFAGTGPVLLVPYGDAVPQTVLNEADRLAPTNVIVLGGTSAVSDAQVAAIEQAAG